MHELQNSLELKACKFQVDFLSSLIGVFSFSFPSELFLVMHFLQFQLNLLLYKFFFCLTLWTACLFTCIIFSSITVNAVSNSSRGEVENPCIPKGYELTTNMSDKKLKKFHPAGNFSACRSEALSLLEKRRGMPRFLFSVELILNAWILWWLHFFSILGIISILRSF